jgi:hypothetical protein
MHSSIGRMALTAMLGLTASMTVQGTPTLLQRINGYTLSSGQLVQFNTGLSDSTGKSEPPATRVPWSRNLRHAYAFFGLHAAVTRQAGPRRPAAGRLASG